VKLERKKNGFIRRKRKDYYEEQLKWPQECDAKSDSKKFYKQVNSTRNGFQAKPLNCRGIEGNSFSDKVDILHRRKKYYSI
jgi:hypothetical protein